MKRDEKVISIALASDQRYFTGLVGTLISVFVNASKEYSYRIYLIDGGIDSLSKKSLFNIVDSIKLNIKLSFIQVDLTNYKNYLPSFYFDSIMPYARLLIPEVLVNVDKIIYIDSDILFFKDIGNLWELNLNGKSSAVAREIIIPELRDDCSNYASLNLKPDAPYFNSGLMIMDLVKFREKEIARKTLEYLKNNKEACKFWDQSALNVTLYDDFILLDQSWNTQSHRKAFKLETEFNKLYNFKINYHFVTSFKPWLYYNNSPQNQLFYTLLSKVNYSFNNPSFNNSQQLYNRKIRFYQWMPIYYKLRSFIRKIQGNQKLSLSDKKIAEFWIEQIPLIKYQNKIKNETTSMLLKWEQRIEECLVRE